MTDQMDVLKNPRQQPEQIRLLLLEVKRLEAAVRKLEDLVHELENDRILQFERLDAEVAKLLTAVTLNASAALAEHIADQEEGE